MRSFKSTDWHANLAGYLAGSQTLAAKYALQRKQNIVPVKIARGQQIALSPGEHSELIRSVIEDFGARFVPGGVLIYAGDTGEKWGYFDAVSLANLGVNVDAHGKMPDVVLYCTERNWLLLIESVTSHGPVDGKRHGELARLFARSTAGLVYVTAFPNRATMSRYLGDIAWETEVWVADAPSHLIHFNGERFLAPTHKPRLAHKQSFPAISLTCGNKQFIRPRRTPGSTEIGAQTMWMARHAVFLASHAEFAAKHEQAMQEFDRKLKALIHIPNRKQSGGEPQ